MKRLLSSAAIAAALALPLAASAATTHPASKHDTLSIQGVISAIDGKWDLTVHDDQGFIENVALHPGTIIAPTGLRLATGMRVSVVGYERGGAVDADRIAGPVGAATEHGTAGSGIGSLMPEEIPSGTFQTTGPSATGGG